jgi:hypothetical protein
MARSITATVPGQPEIRLVSVLFLSLVLVACRAELLNSTPTQPGVTWDSDPSTLILRHYSPSTTAGLAGAFDRRYYIPEVQLWGDGRILWVTRDGSGRRIMEGKLTSGQMRALLGQIVGAGFFDWEETYYTPGGHSFPFMHLQVNLADRTKEIKVHGGAPVPYPALVELLQSGAGAAGQPYVPARGFLTASPGPAGPTGTPWPAGTSVTPDQVGAGIYIEGDALAFAWNLVNSNPTAPVYVQFGGQTYHIMVQVSGVSYFEPPPG